ncbi:OprO/OprP family phosphate-selective porin [Lacinutrix sp. C3R15]|uniref:porin n=1 Tax=Flavobacteriaceae TaxID=49546 RepID=UPI001C09BE45|nr:MULTISPECIES: porin [Flavobacteriaceae]MBU2938314.1 OprO/OprP family phosphate-selective porin [Lacinutrix sp. C3R15]MDO6621628.1 porin [Oceanihabitans sp. 1_MG-2023]
MNIRYLLIAISLLAINSLRAQENQASKFGQGLFNLIGKDSTFTMKIGARMQFLAMSSWQEGEANESNFLVRRARFKFDGFALTPKLKYKIELGASNRDIAGASEYTSNAPRYILDAVIKWNFHKNFVLWFGQTKLPGNRERIISSANMQLVDRSLLNRRFNIDRDLGIQLRHHFNISDTFIIKEAFAISQGEGRNITSGNIGGHQYTTRIEFLPFGNFSGNGDYVGSSLQREATSKLAIGVTYDYNNNAVKTRSNQGDYMINENGDFHETNISTLFIDAMFKYKGVSFMAEYANRNADDVFYTNEDNEIKAVQIGNALNLQAGYLFKKNWEISGRYTNIDWNKRIENQNENQYTIGVSKYIVGHKLKVQSDISHLETTNSNNELMYRLQFEIHF